MSKFHKGDQVQYFRHEGDPENGRLFQHGTVVSIVMMGYDSDNPVLHIQAEDGRVVVRHGNTVTVTKPAELTTAPAPGRPVLWRRRVGPRLAVAIDDSGSLVLDVGRAAAEHITVSDGDALIQAIIECRTFAATWDAAQRECDGDLEKAAELVAEAFPYPAADLG